MSLKLEKIIERVIFLGRNCDDYEELQFWLDQLENEFLKDVPALLKPTKTNGKE